MNDYGKYESTPITKNTKHGKIITSEIITSETITSEIITSKYITLNYLC